MISDENRGSGVSNRNRPIDNSIYIPPEVNAPGRNIDKDIVYITPGTADTRNEEPPLLGSPRRNESRGAPTRKKWPWWLFFVIGVLVIAVISAGIYYYYKHRMSSTKVAIDPTLTTTNTTQKLTGVTCDKGFFEHNGKCITCPGGTTWNGFECQIANGQPSLRYNTMPSRTGSR